MSMMQEDKRGTQVVVLNREVVRNWSSVKISQRSIYKQYDWLKRQRYGYYDKDFYTCQNLNNDVPFHSWSNYKLSKLAF